MRVVRWKAAAPLGVLLGLLVLGWVFYVDLGLERAVEYAGAEIVGARVDVASADLQLARGRVIIRGLAAANPDAPMKNLVEASEIVAAIQVRPLLEKKVIIDTVAVRGVRFGTPRAESGALSNPGPTTGRIGRRVAAWADRIRIPPLSLEGLGTVVNVSGIRPDSLRSLMEARQVAAAADSLDGVWQRALASVDPRPQIDSARAVAARLRAADVRALGLTGARSLAESGRSAVRELDGAAGRLSALDERIVGGVGAARGRMDALAAARRADYAYALRLVNIPSLDTPDLSPALFGEVMLERVRPLLYWLQVAEQYLPPGLDPRRYAGPERLRAAGTTVRFPQERAEPSFLLRRAEADVEIGGAGNAAGRYTALLEGLTSAPAIYGRPTRLVARRATAGGVRAGGVRLVLDHVDLPLRDSIDVQLQGIPLPSVTLSAAAARLHLGNGATTISLVRTGDSVQGRIFWRSSDVRWERLGGQVAEAAASRVGSRAWAEDLMWRAVSRLNTVEIETRLAGALSGPRLGVSSNVGREVAAALRREVGAEIARAEQRVRAEVDRLVGEQVETARGRMSAVQSQVEGEIARRRADLERVKQELETEIRNLTRRLPVRIPGGE